MLGPLPTAYQVAVTLYTFGVFSVLGVWAAYTLPILPLTGACFGAALGGIAALLLIHEPDPHPAPAHTHRPSRGS